MKQVIKTRKWNGGTYQFILEPGYIKCYTPENCFGYRDIVLLSEPQLTSVDGKISYKTRHAYAIHRELTPWVLKRIEAVMLDLERYLDIGYKGYKHFTLSGEPLILEAIK